MAATYNTSGSPLPGFEPRDAESPLAFERERAPPTLPNPLRSLVVVPVAAFVAMSFASAFLWDAMPLPALLAVLTLLISLPLSMPRSYIKSGALAAGKMLPVGMCILAVVAGMLTGVYAFEVHTGPFYAMALGRSYDNVLASTPGAAYADAGKIRFADSSLVQVDLSVGYRRSPTFCVAPIMDSGDAQLRTVAFWAAGLDCCPSRGSFMCGAGRTTARAGVRMGPDGMFTKVNREFRRAVAQAAIVADLAVDQDPILLQWVEDPEAEQLSKFLGALSVVGFGSAFFAVAALGVYIVSRSLERSK